MKKLLVLLFSILISFNSYGDNILYCNDELTTGIQYLDGKSKVIKEFTNFRYTIKFNNDYSILSGLTNFDWDCFDAYDTKKYNAIACVSPYQNGGSFSYHKISKKYIYLISGTEGYIGGKSENNDIVISAGNCKEF